LLTHTSNRFYLAPKMGDDEEEEAEEEDDNVKMEEE
jgi:hypothetical protein